MASNVFSNEKKGKIRSKTIRFLIGLFLCLFCFCLVLDIGPISRALNFPILFLFGFGVYFLFSIIFFFGMVLIFKDDFKFHFSFFCFFGLLITFIGAIILLTHNLYKNEALFAHDTILNFENFQSIYSHYFENFFRDLSHIYIYQGENIHIGGGLIGYFFVSVLNFLFNGDEQITLVVSILLVVFGSLLLITPPFVRHFVAKNKGKKVMKKVNQNDSYYIGKIGEQNNGLKDRYKETIKNASVYVSLDHFKDSEIEFSSHSEHSSDGSLSFLKGDNSQSPGLHKARFGKELSFDSSSETINKENKQNKENIVKEKKIEKVQLELEFNEETNALINDDKDKNIENNINSNEEEIDYFDGESSFSKDEIIIAKSENNTTSLFENNEVETNEDNNNEVKEKPIVLERRKFIPPDPGLLTTYEVQESIDKNKEIAEIRKQAISDILANYKIGAYCSGYVIGPAVTRYNISYSSNVSVRSVSNYVNDISIRLGGINTRFEPIVAGEPYSGLEIANATITTVGFKDVFTSLPDPKAHPLAIGFGKDIAGKVVYADFNKFPHMLVAGATGSGKSIFVHSLLLTLIMRNSPDDLALVLIDPKKVELALYKDMPHLLCPIISESEKAYICLQKLVDEMEERYSTLQRTEFTDISQYNEYCETHKEEKKMPYIVVIMDEYADLADSCKEIAQPVVRIAQKARAAGIHLLIATQRPSTNVITGTIKGNLPTHVAFRTSNYTDSMTILGEGGAQTLLGKGDSLLQSPEVSRVGLVRAQAPFVQVSEIKAVVNFLKSTMETRFDPNYLDLNDHSKDTASLATPLGPTLSEGGVIDERYEDVKTVVMSEQYYSISKMQREFGFGFGRAGKIFSRLQKEGIIADKPDTPGSAKGCKVLVHSNDEEDFDVVSDEISGFDTRYN